ncbi:MAG: TraR/DksA family transcriptional regulator [Thermodesulfobacteriota bacterium]
MATVRKTKKTAAKKEAGAAKKKPLKAAVKSASQRPKRTKQVSFKKEMTRILLDAKKKILQEFTQKVRSESDDLKRETGDIYDLASTERERELKLVLGDRDRKKLTEIEHALERINESSYGTCEECEEPITEKRLKVLPFTRVCVDCQSKNEREQKIRGGVEEETGFGIVERHDTEEDVN